MWNTETVKELFKELDSVWENGFFRPLSIEYKECIGNFISFADFEFDEDKAILYISDMIINNSDISDDIIRIDLIINYLKIAHIYEIGRFLHAKNPSGIIEFINGIAKHICEKCGYAYYTFDEVNDILGDKAQEYIEKVLVDNKESVVIKRMGKEEEYKIKEIIGSEIKICSVDSGEIIDLNDLKKGKSTLPYLTVTI